MPENEREKFPEVVKLLDKYREMTLEEILNNPEIEAVVVDTEEIYLTKYALMAAQHGEHIHMEKPGGVSHSEFERLIATMKETKKYSIQDICTVIILILLSLCKKSKTVSLAK